MIRAALKVLAYQPIDRVRIEYPLLAHLIGSQQVADEGPQIRGEPIFYGNTETLLGPIDTFRRNMGGGYSF